VAGTLHVRHEVEALALPGGLEITNADDAWIEAIKGGARSRGSFESVAPLAEATALAGVAYRMAGRSLDWDAANMTFTSAPEADRRLRRTYRRGWEL
jgi:hypothetical protein